MNTNKSFRISSPFFEGELQASIRDFVNESGQKIPNGPYLDHSGKEAITWSIVTKGSLPRH
jgi:hypothetical protein